MREEEFKFGDAPEGYEYCYQCGDEHPRGTSCDQGWFAQKMKNPNFRKFLYETFEFEKYCPNAIDIIEKENKE